MEILVNEQSYLKFVDTILSEALYPISDKVLLIKDYLDKNFVRQTSDTIDENGYPTKEYNIAMVSRNKTILKVFTFNELLILLDDKFHRFFKEDSDRKKFLKQVIYDWFHKKIQKNGLLSVNYII